MSFVPDMAVLLAYSLACLVLFITPGPDMSLFVAKTLSGGRRAGIAAMAGAMIGCVVHSLLAAFGLSALIAASPCGLSCPQDCWRALSFLARRRCRTQRLGP